MAIQVCRDFLTIGNPINLFSPWLVQYYLAIFARVCCNYVLVGQTNFDIDGALRVATGAAGSLNQGAGNEYAFNPTGHTVSTADIGRILAVKSPNNPMVNSGLFRVTAVDTGNNWLYINYRSGDIPPAETGMKWSLFVDELTFWNVYLIVQGTPNGIVGTYQGQGTATQSRIILQSPSSLNWQVRISYENTYDTAAGGGGVSPCAGFSNGATVAPGYGGNTAGDFPAGGQHLHAGLFFNGHTNDIFGRTVGFWPANGSQSRVYMWGDDSTGSIFACSRNVVGGSDAMVHFGLCEDEEQPLPAKAVQRLFAIGGNALANGGNNGIYWAVGNGTAHGGVAFGLSNQPISAIYSLYNPLDQSNWPGNTSTRGSIYAGDNQYLAATELLPVDVVVGTHDNFNGFFNTSAEFMVLEGRRLGRAPMTQMGRSNYGYFQVATDINRSWIHLNDGIYLPWQGSILP